jgi:hypothetical protein
MFGSKGSGPGDRRGECKQHEPRRDAKARSVFLGEDHGAADRSNQDQRRTQLVYEREDFIANPLHYLALLEQKPRALDQAAPLDGWVLAEPMHRIRRLMEARSGKEGRREFIQVLRLCERFEQPLVEWAVARALEMGAISFDAVKMIALA